MKQHSNSNRLMGKRVFVGFVLFFISIASAVAQDIITLKNGTDIKALVKEIDDGIVKYKKFDNPDGPNYTLKSSDIYIIKYSNGNVDVFSNDGKLISTPATQPNAKGRVQQEQQPEEQQEEQPVVHKQDRFEPIYTPKPNVKSRYQNRPSDTTDYAAFTRLRNNDNAMEEFLKANDAALYRQFHTGASLRQSGKTFLGLGLVLTGVGVGLFVVGAVQINDNPDFGSGFNLALVGATCFSVGQVFTIVSIPLSAVGGGLKRRAANGYEEKYFNRSKTYSRTSLNLTLTGNGVGFALRF